MLCPPRTGRKAEGAKAEADEAVIVAATTAETLCHIPSRNSERSVAGQGGADGFLELISRPAASRCASSAKVALSSGSRVLARAPQDKKFLSAAWSAKMGIFGARQIAHIWTAARQRVWLGAPHASGEAFAPTGGRPQVKACQHTQDPLPRGAASYTAYKHRSGPFGKAFCKNV